MPMDHESARQETDRARSQTKQWLHAESRACIYRVLCTLVALTIWFLLSNGFSASVLASAMMGAALFTCLFAFVLREPLGAACLSRWGRGNRLSGHWLPGQALRLAGLICPIYESPPSACLEFICTFRHLLPRRNSASSPPGCGQSLGTDPRSHPRIARVRTMSSQMGAVICWM